MATPLEKVDSYFASRLSTRTRPTVSALKDSSQTPARSPRTPTVPSLGRSISAQWGSPGGFRSEQEDIIVYELDARYLSAGHSGESRPRCILPFTPDDDRRAGDYRQYDAEHVASQREWRLKKPWAAGHELYQIDLRELDLELVEAKLDRAVRTVHTDYLQLDAKPRKAVLTIPSLLPTPLLEIALKVIFGHFTQPPSIVVLTTPVMCCVSAGLRDALIVDIGWEETMVTAVGEYKEVAHGSSLRAGKLLTWEMGTVLEHQIRSADSASRDNFKVTFEEAEDIVQRMAWVQPRDTPDGGHDTPVQLPIFGSEPPKTASCPFSKVAEPAEKALFALGSTPKDLDDHDLPLHSLVYRILLSLPVDLRAICASRIVVTGVGSKLPGLKGRLLQEIQHFVDTRGWDSVSNYGSARSRHEKALKERSSNAALLPLSLDEKKSRVSFSPLHMPLQEGVPHVDRVHDDIDDPVTRKAEREGTKLKDAVAKGVVRGVETLGSWAGASLLASLRVTGVHAIERDEFLKNGLRNEMNNI